MEELVRQLQEQGYLTTPRIIEAFRAVSRDAFVAHELREDAGRNEPLSIGYGQTISQPLTVALMLELLQPVPGEHVLDVGAGSGWTAALLKHLVGKKGSVTAIERVPQLRRFAEENLKRAGANVTILGGDGSAGASQHAPFDVIHVAAAAHHGVPKALQEQLAVGGRLIVPVGEAMQTLTLVTRVTAGRFTTRHVPGFSFVPLIEGVNAFAH